MKYCPNPACPTLKKLGMVAEYEDQVAYCDDCGTLLISADSPPQITSQPVQVAGQKSDFGEEAALLGTFESWEDAEACLEEFERFDIWAQVTELSLYDADTSCFSNGLVAKAEFSTKHGFRIISSEEVLGSENSYLYQLIERERGQISTAFSHLYPVRQRAGAMVVITSDKMRQQQPEDDTPHWYGWAHRSDDKLELTFTVGQETINVGDGSVVAGTNICFESLRPQTLVFATAAS